MITELFLYFAQFPSKKGIKAMATMGKSQFRQYDELLFALDELPKISRVPEIENYVYGQTFEDIQQRLDKLIGSFLFVDYGEFDMLGDGRRSYQVTQRLAVTVAIRMTDRSDLMERMIASDESLKLLNKVHAWMMADSEKGNLEWLSRENLDKAEIIPFVSSELRSYGWTLMLDATAPDMLGTHALSKSFAATLE